MPYQHIENIRSRSGEKVALLLTFENVIGLVALAAPAYAISAGWPFWLRMPVIIAAAMLGVMVTLDIGGMPFYQRVIWQVRGMLRMRMRGYHVDISDLPGVPQSALRTPVIPVGGPIQPWVAAKTHQASSKVLLVQQLVPAEQELQALQDRSLHSIIDPNEKHEASYAGV